MAIAVICQGCGWAFRVEDRSSGRQSKCPRCDHVVRVPSRAKTGDTPLKREAVPPRRADVQSARSTSGDNDDVACSLREREETTRGASRPQSSATDPRVQSYAARRRGLRLPVWSWFAASGVVLATILAWAVIHHRRQVDLRQSRQAAADSDSAEQTPTGRNGPSRPARPSSERVESAKPAAGAPWEEIYPFVENGIVRIETYDRDNNRTGLGSGFVIDARGLVATNYHVASAAYDKADVLFNDGTRFGIEGYTAIEPARDLAILKLNGVPRNIRALTLQPAKVPLKASPVYAIGHPRNHSFVPTSGILGRFMKTTQLPAESRGFLEAILGDVPDNQWIEHDAEISPGNSGGPLLNAAGEVIGINTWVNSETRLGYAIHVSHLKQLADRATEDVAALRDHYRKSEQTRAGTGRAVEDPAADFFVNGQSPCVGR